MPEMNNTVEMGMKYIYVPQALGYRWKRSKGKMRRPLLSPGMLALEGTLCDLDRQLSTRSMLWMGRYIPVFLLLALTDLGRSFPDDLRIT